MRLYQLRNYGQYRCVKTTLDIRDELLLQAKRHAKTTGRPLRAVVEEGLRTVLLRIPEHCRMTQSEPIA